MARKRLAFSEQVRRAIIDCGMTRYAIYKQTGVSQATLSRFITGRGSLSLESLDKIAECIGLRAELDRPKTATKRRQTTTKKGK